MIRARSLKALERQAWPVEKLGIMEEIIRAKVQQHDYVRIELLRTGDRELIENSPTDSYWGRGPDWQGQNHLGKLWMKLREEIRNNPE
jgi:ribA/ribD-fused uncharacterized protein